MTKKTKAQIKWEQEQAARHNFDLGQEIGVRDFGWLWFHANKLADERVTSGFDHSGFAQPEDLITKAVMTVSVLSALQEAKTLYDQRSLRLFGMIVTLRKE